MARFPFRRKKTKQRELSEAERNRRLLLSVVLQVGFWGMLIIIGVVAAVNAILGSSLFIPKSADGVLDSVKEMPAYTWSSESVRRVELAGETQEQHAARSATVDLEDNKFQNIVAGVIPERTIYISDGNYAIAIDETASGSGTPGRLITDVCDGAATIPADTTRMPSAEEIKAASPKLVSDQETVLGTRAWQIDFELEPALIERLLWVPFFEQAEPEKMDWVISADELEAIRAGDYETEFASAYVTREERILAMIDVKFEIEGGSGWRILAQYVPNENERPLESTDLGEPACQ